MVEVDQKQFELIRHFVELLESVEEGVTYIAEQYREGEVEAGDKVLSDVFLAFSQFESANETLLILFDGEQKVKEDLKQFYVLIEIIGELEKEFMDVSARKRIVLDKLIPAFLDWKERIGTDFRTYLQH